MSNPRLEFLINGLSDFIEQKKVEDKKVKFPKYLRGNDESLKEFRLRNQIDDLKNFGENLLVISGIGSIGYFICSNYDVIENIVYKIFK